MKEWRSIGIKCLREYFFQCNFFPFPPNHKQMYCGVKQSWMNGGGEAAQLVLPCCECNCGGKFEKNCVVCGEQSEREKMHLKFMHWNDSRVQFQSSRMNLSVYTVNVWRCRRQVNFHEQTIYRFCSSTTSIKLDWKDGSWVRFRFLINILQSCFAWQFYSDHCHLIIKKLLTLKLVW